MRIGALPSLATGAYDRRIAQEWARTIYEDQPAVEHVSGLRYNAAHTNGVALALWDTDDAVETVRADSGQLQDFALADPRIWSRVVTACDQLAMTVSRISEGDCNLG